jgi:hypothetical protein
MELGQDEKIPDERFSTCSNSNHISNFWNTRFLFLFHFPSFLNRYLERLCFPTFQCFPVFCSSVPLSIYIIEKQIKTSTYTHIYSDFTYIGKSWHIGTTGTRSAPFSAFEIGADFFISRGTDSILSF